MPRVPDLPATLTERANRLRESARAAGVRIPALITGGGAGTARCAEAITVGRDVLRLPAHASAGEAARYLGGEVTDVILDAHRGIDPDLLGLTAGLAVAGGFFVVRAPPRHGWSDGGDRSLSRLAQHPHGPRDFAGGFLERLAALLDTDTGVWRITPAGDRPPVIPPTRPAARPPDGACLTAGQAGVVAELLAGLTAAAPWPIVVRADRGRGKSAALGIAAARIARADPAVRITLTAPQQTAIAAARAALHREARASGDDRMVKRVRFRPPERVAADPGPGPLLVDEAAALPTRLLVRLLRAHPRIAFATTVHGYEGSGHGFDVRFRRILDRETPRWSERRLREPVRWAAGDRLESTVNALLALDADVSPPPPSLPAVGREDRTALATKEGRLRACFGLLVSAHYRTRPSDLRLLLDAPFQRLWLAGRGRAVVGAGLAAEEGGFDELNAEAIWYGDFRPRGHLLARSLAVHAGLIEAPLARGWRIARIAVHPQRRRRMLGSRLVEAIAEAATGQGVDYLGTSFGATPELIAFWLANGFQPIRLGTRRDATTGTQSVFMMRALTEQGRALARGAAAALARDLPWLQTGPLAEIEPEVLAPIRDSLPDGSADPRDDRTEAGLFAAGRRAYASALPALGRLATANGSAPPALLGAILEGKSWAKIAAELQVSGRRAALAELRGGVRRWLAEIG